MVLESKGELVVRVLDYLLQLWRDVKFGLKIGLSHFVFSAVASVFFKFLASRAFSCFLLSLNLLLLELFLSLFFLKLLFFDLGLPLYLLLLFLGDRSRGKTVEEDFEVVVDFKRLDML